MKVLQLLQAGALSCALAFSLSGCKQASLDLDTTNPVNPLTTQEKAVGLAEHLILGNPSNATTSISNPNNYLLVKNGYVASYNRSKAHANWVAWALNPSWLGSTSRQDNFRADATLPSGWYQVKSTDYASTGFDRGHLCPSGDRTNTVTSNSETFLMTNMMPQSPNNNRITWEGLESYARTLVNSGNECYIYAGSYGTGGTGSNGYKTSFNGINVPARTWKIVLVIPQGTNDLQRINSNTRVIAVDMPNNQTLSSDWRQFRVSVRNLEGKTGYNFFSALSQSIQDVIENKVDNL